MGGFFADAAIDCEPTAYVAAEMRGGCTRYERRALADSVPPSQAAADDAQRAEARLRQLEYCRRRGIDVAIDEAHLGSDIAPRVSRQPRNVSRSIVPPKSR